jgi:hypothetical protein
MSYCSKERLRRKIAREVEEFLSLGGVIEKVPKKRFCPPTMNWAHDRGFDYTPWARTGAAEIYVNQTRLDEGCYMTKPSETGE